jgi:hypothetical protein
MTDDWPATTENVDEVAHRLFGGYGTRTTGEDREQGEVTMTADLSAIKHDLSKLREDVQTILEYLSDLVNAAPAALRRPAGEEYDLENYIGMWADMDPEDRALFDEVLEERNHFLDTFDPQAPEQ